VSDRRGEVTRLLRAGDRNGLLELVYDELRLIAARRMAAERGAHTLQATALVHEAYVRLFHPDSESWEERRHFYATASEAMRRILIEHARRGGAQKRGGSAARVTLGAADIPVELDFDRAAALHEALEILEQEDERAASVARLRFLIGLEVEETAKALSISERTVRREWTYARARLFEILNGS